MTIRALALVFEPFSTTLRTQCQGLHLLGLPDSGTQRVGGCLSCDMQPGKRLHVRIVVPTAHATDTEVNQRS